MLRRSAPIAALVLAHAAAAHAGGELELGSPRSVGHAGASLVSDDGLAAAFTCPAAIARRDAARAQLATLVIGDDAWLVTDDHPRVRDLGPSELAPAVGAQAGWGRLVLGASAAVTGSLDRRLPTAAPGLPDAAVIADHPHRYAGTELRLTRTTVALAAALRVTDWLAVGGALTAAQVEVREGRRLWAGFSGRDGLGAPGRDVAVALTARDRFVPGVVLGALAAPADVPIELALGAAWSAPAHARGELALAPVRASPVVEATTPTAAASLGATVTVGAGVRWLGDWWAAEAGASATTYPGADRAWTVTGVRVIDDSGATAPLDQLATRLPRRSHGAVRASLEAEVVPGFLWVSAGWAWRGAGATRVDTTTVGVDPGGHTLALGAELSAGAAVITLGVARQLPRTVTVTEPALVADNPLRGGGVPANPGEHGTQRDLIGLGVELTWP